MPRPLLIGIIGDSFTAGEGAPNSKSSIIPPQQAHWTSSRRHHSKKSGFNLALKKFREDNPELWLVYKNVASSGATFTPHAAGFSGGYSTDQLTDRDLIALTLPIIVNGIPVPVPWIHASQTNVRNPAQVDSLEQWVDGLPFDAEKLDIVLMMGGGNDAGFGSIITSAILGNALTLGFSGTVFIPSNDEVEVKLSDARPHVRFFSDRLRDKLNPENVYWINYPNFFRNNRGERASSDNRDGVSFQASAVGNVALMAISNNIGGEVLHRGESIITGILNPFVSEMCRDEIDNCTVVDITEALGTNGLNQSDSSRRAVNTILDAQEKIQGSIDGGIHPNERGYQAYVAPVVDQLNENYHPIEGSNYAIYSSPKNYLELQSTRSRTFNSATTTRRPSRSARVSLNSIPNITEAEESNCGVFRNQLDHVEWVKFEKLPPDLYQTMRRKYRNSPKLLEKLQNYYDGMTQIGWKIRKEEYCNAVKEATQNIKNH
jgi:lysophospholipase L1-like esterase